MLKWLGIGGATALAGCSNNNTNDGGGGGTETPTQKKTTQEVADFSKFKKGGTLKIGIGANIKSFDPPYSSDTTSSQGQGFIFEGLLTGDRRGNNYPWLAKDYELVKTQDIDRTAYGDYMTKAGTTKKGAVDTNKQIIVTHPKDNPAQKDMVRVLFPKQAKKAAEDGTFGMHYHVTLRKGIKFQNGEELTADNVVQTAKRYHNSKVSAQTFDSVLHVGKAGKYEVDMYAQVPDAEGESQVVGAFTILSTKQTDLKGGKMDPREGNTPVGTGPYALDSFTDKESATYTKSDNYWVEQKGLDSLEWFDGPDNFPDGPAFDKINIQIVPDPSTRSAALQNGEIDITSGLNADTLDTFKKSKKFTISSVEAGGYTYIQCPLNIKPWDDPRLRKAVNHLIPRKRIVKNILSGYGRAAWTPLPELAYASGTADPEKLESDLKPTNKYDPKKAKKLMDEAIDDLGLEKPLEVQLETNSDNQDRVSQVQLIAKAMESTGYFKTNVKTYEFNKYVGRVLDPEYPKKAIIPCIGLSGTFNPGSFCDALNGSENIGQCCNLTGVNDSKLDTMMNDARFGIKAAKNADVRKKRYDKIWRYLAEKRYSSIIQFGLETGIMSTDVKGFSPYPFDESLYSYAVHAPTDSQAIWLNRG